MVGSTMSGLGTEDSDIDMCLLVKPTLPDSRIDAVSNLEQIRDILASSGKLLFVESMFFSTYHFDIVMLQRLIYLTILYLYKILHFILCFKKISLK